MEKDTSALREEAIEILAGYGITGSLVYLIDVIPLIEMIWADGKAQESEIAILEDYLVQHVRHINALADHEVLTFETARTFVLKFLKNRPDPELLKQLRSLITPVRLSSSDETENSALKESLLAACLDIGASNVVRYPYGLNDRFNPEEKRCWMEILESLEQK